MLLYGSGRERIDFVLKRRSDRWSYRKPFEGVIPNLTRRYRESKSAAIREEIECYMNRPYPCCFIDPDRGLVPPVRAGVKTRWPIALLAYDDRGQPWHKVVILDAHSRQGRDTFTIMVQRASYLALTARQAQACVHLYHA